MKRLDDLRDLLAQARFILDEFEAKGLRVPEQYVMGWNENEYATAAKALSILDSDAPMQERFPDGSRAYPPYTPAQVILLARGAGWVDHTEVAYNRLQEAVREHLGRAESRTCAGTTKTGYPCRSYALAYPLPDTPEGFRVCHSHASPGERAHNKRMGQHEDEMLKQGIRLLAERETAGEDPLDALDDVIETTIEEHTP